VRWYADDSDIKTIKDQHVPNIVLFGGFVIEPSVEIALCADIEKAKAKFTSPRNPVKWNFRDLKSKYTEQGHEEAYSNMLTKMRDIRIAIFEAASKHDFCIILSVVEGYSSDKKVLKDVKSDLSRYVFTNSLMRFALHARDTSTTRPEIILDWPDGGISKPYDNEYASAYNFGKTKDGVKFHSGPLKDLNFADSPLFARMPHNTMLQFADLLVGVTREFICHVIDPGKKGQGLSLVKLISEKYRGYPNVVGRGINLGSGSQELSKEISKKFEDLYVSS